MQSNENNDNNIYWIQTKNISL